MDAEESWVTPMELVVDWAASGGGGGGGAARGEQLGGTVSDHIDWTLGKRKFNQSCQPRKDRKRIG